MAHAQSTPADLIALMRAARDAEAALDAHRYQNSRQNLTDDEQVAFDLNKSRLMQSYIEAHFAYKKACDAATQETA